MKNNDGLNKVYLHSEKERAINVADIVRSITDVVRVGDPIFDETLEDTFVPRGVTFTITIIAKHNDGNECMYTMYINSQGDPVITKRIQRVATGSCFVLDSFPYTSEKVSNFDLSKIKHIHSFKTNHDFTAFLDCTGPGGEVTKTAMKLQKIKMMIELNGIRRKSDLGLAKIPANKAYL